MSNSLTFVGTATTVIDYGGFTVLTDPNFLHRGERAYLGKGLWSRRLTEPSLGIADLPPLDAVVLSHLHGDHFDRRARKGLDRALPILTTRQAARRLRGWGFAQAVALDTWTTHELTKDGSVLRVTACPGRHHLGMMQALLPPVMGSVLEFVPADAAPLTIYITGDTLVHEALREVPVRYPQLDVGLWHLGGTRVLGALVTMDAAQGADLWEMVRPQHTVPIHYDDYGVFRSPLADFLAEAARRGITGVRPIARGETVPLPVTR